MATLPTDIQTTAEKLIRELNNELEKTIGFCKKNTNISTVWLHDFFLPAQAALHNKDATVIRKLADACFHMQVFGGMGSWNDVGGGNLRELSRAYSEANNFYQECWEKGLK